MIRRFARPLVALALAWVAVAASAETATRNDGVLVLGRISDNPRGHYEQLSALLDYVVPRLAGVGIREGRVLMARDAQQMASYLRRGRVDWVTETAAMGLVLVERTGARVLVGTERDGVSMYHSVVFVRRDSGIRDLQGLRGRSIAFQHPNSTTAYLVPAAELLHAGLHLEQLLSPRDRPEPATVGYLFAQSESNVSTWVHKRLVDAGTYSNLDWGNLHRLPAAYREDLEVIHTTSPYPRGLELVRAGLPAPIERALRALLLAAADDPEAREPLLRFFGTTRFFAIDPPTEKSLNALAQRVRRVRAALE